MTSIVGAYATEERPRLLVSPEGLRPVLLVLSNNNCGTEYDRCAISSCNGLEEMLPGLVLACKFALLEISRCTESS